MKNNDLDESQVKDYSALVSEMHKQKEITTLDELNSFVDHLGDLLLNNRKKDNNNE